MKDFQLNTPLHIAATKNYVSVARMLAEMYPTVLLVTNGQGDLPVETAIRHGQDDVRDVRAMDHRRLVHLRNLRVLQNSLF